MLVFENPHDIRTNLRRLYCEGNSIGFVPTMGALHQGHGSLIQKAASENDITVVSIFVNPTQFGPQEDLEKYPRTLKADLDLCRQMGATHIFTPTTQTIYPMGRDHHQVMFSLRDMDQILCGAKRPGHFNGVLQVVSILFNIMEPTKAYFGEKDFQQLAILRTLARELFFSVKVVGCPIIRQEDGLAMSSRNRYLNEEERKQALFLSKTLKKVREFAREGMKVNDVLSMVQAEAEQYPLIRMDYFDIYRSADLAKVDTLTRAEHPRAFVAAFCGSTRLIDNMPVFAS